MAPQIIELVDRGQLRRIWLEAAFGEPTRIEVAKAGGGWGGARRSP